MCKSFVRPNVNSDDVIYEAAHSKSFHAKLELHQYNAAFVITEVIKETSKGKLYQELGLRTLYWRSWFEKAVSFSISEQSVFYFFELILNNTRYHLPEMQVIWQHQCLP